jgi:hypothetical protein
MAARLVVTAHDSNSTAGSDIPGASLNLGVGSVVCVRPEGVRQVKTPALEGSAGTPIVAM